MGAWFLVATLVNIRPTDMGNLTLLMPVTFSVQGGAPAAFIAIWVRYEGVDDEVLVYDGTNFQYPFDINSFLERPTGSDDLVAFSILPERGWLRNIDKFRVQGDPTIT